jgi:ribosomal protein L16 Arg81 hydroxylase
MWVYKFSHHKEIKNKLLELISTIEDKTLKSEKDRISKTDWFLPKDYNREYLNLFYNKINDCMDLMCNQLKTKNWQIHNGWFQQYNKNDKHTWHLHEGCSMSAVYYLELPNKNLTTEFINGQKPKVKEGDVLFFPSFYLHRSPINNSKKRKTVIAFNCSFYDWNEKYIIN